MFDESSFEIECSGDLHVFADYLEERGDPRAEEARRRAVLAEFAERVARGAFDHLLDEAEGVLRARRAQVAEARRAEQRRASLEQVVPGARVAVYVDDGRRRRRCECTVTAVDGERVTLEHRYARRGSRRVRTIECGRVHCHPM